MSYINIVKEFIIETFLFGDDRNLQNDTSFLNNGIIDSTGMLELITFLEETFSISIMDDELIPKNLDSINNVNAFITKKLGNDTET